MKKIILLLSLLIVCGCDYKELTDMSIVTMIAIDKKEEYEVIIEVLDYQDENKTIYYENNDKTLNSALNGILLKSPKTLYMGHLRNVLVTTSLAEDDITSIFDYMLRNSKMEKDFNLLLINDFDEIKKIKEKDSSESLSSKIDTASFYNGEITKVTFDTFVSNTLQIGIDPVLPVISIKDDNIILEPYIGIFKDNKLIGYLDSDATTGYNLLNKNINNIITFKCDNNNYASVELNNLNKSNMYFDINTNMINIDLDIKATLTEINCDINLEDKDNINNLNDKFNNRIKEIINKTIYYEKEYNSDYLGIVSYIYKNNYKEYKNINSNIVKNFNTNINIKTSFTSNGSLKKGDEKY